MNDEICRGDLLIAHALEDHRPAADIADELHRCNVGVVQFGHYATRKMGILSSVRHQVLAELAALEAGAKGPAMAGAVAWKPGDRR